MLIAESTAVCRAYPHVPAAAVEQLLHALHRAVPLIEAGRMDQAVLGLRTDLAGYRGPLADLERLGVRSIFRAAAHGRHQLANQLGQLRLLRAERETPRYVLTGDILSARLWAAQRRIGLSQITVLARGADCAKLAGVDAHRMIIIELEAPRDPVVAQQVRTLRERGAMTRDRAWHPGRVPAYPGDCHTGPPPMGWRAQAN